MPGRYKSPGVVRRVGERRGEEIKNRNAFLAYLRKYLPLALDAHLYDEVKYLTEAYIDHEETAKA